MHTNAIISKARQIAGIELAFFVTNQACTRVTKAHSRSIAQELKRRDDAILAAQKAKIQNERETKERKKRRAELREEVRIERLE